MSSELVPVAEYALMQRDVTTMLAQIQENLDGEKLSQWDLPRIKIPAGGGLSWEIPTISGVDTTREIIGIPVYQTMMRSYWSTPDPVEGTPPDCSSPDAKFGFGDPGGDCEICPLAQFASAHNGRGQACKIRRMLFVLREDDTIPVLISLPPTSVKPWRNFLLQASSIGPYYGMQVGLSLSKKTSNGYTHSILNPRLVEALSGDMLERARTYHEMFTALMSSESGQRMAREVAADDGTETINL